MKIFHSFATGPITAARQRAEMLFLAGFNRPNLVSIYDARVVSIFPGGTMNHDLGSQTSYLVMNSSTA